MEEMAYIDSICNKKVISLYTSNCASYFFQVVRETVSRYGRHLTVAHALLTNSESYVVND